MKSRLVALFVPLVSVLAASHAVAQVQIRIGDPARATYSELHEALRDGTPAGDSVEPSSASGKPARLWRRLHAAINGTGDWNSGLIALTRLAELRSRAYADSAARLKRRLETAEGIPFPKNPGLQADDIEPSLQAILLERRRAVSGDSAVLADILARIPTRKYDHGDAWVLGRLGAGAVGLGGRRGFSRRGPGVPGPLSDVALLLHRSRADPAHVAGVCVRPTASAFRCGYGIRASDALLWIGTRESLQALLDARERARERGVYADPRSTAAATISSPTTARR